MTLRIFETDDAKYYLGLGRHNTSSKPIFEDLDFSGIDFIVFEDICFDPKTLEKHLIHGEQYSELYDKIINENPHISVYGVDIRYDSEHDSSKKKYSNYIFTLPITLGSVAMLKIGGSIIKNRKRISRGEFLKKSSGLWLATFFTLPLFQRLLNSGETDHPILNDIYNINSNIIPNPTLAFRDAIVVKKISEYLVPKHKMPGKKVQGAILYGAGHSGIETKLKNPWITDYTLKFFNDIINYNPDSRKYLNEIRQVINDNRKIETKVYDCGLF